MSLKYWNGQPLPDPPDGYEWYLDMDRDVPELYPVSRPLEITAPVCASVCVLIEGRPLPLLGLKDWLLITLGNLLRWWRG